MGLLDIFLLAVGLSMDSFAVSVSGGATMKRFSFPLALKTALILAVFQGAMPVIGWAAGEHFKSLIESIDHWIAFGLLSFLGVKMILESIPERKKEDKSAACRCEETPHPWKLRTLLCIALATSIDALAVGVSLAFLSIRIALAAGIIFAVTLLLSLAGIGTGVRFGIRLNRWATLTGGAILVGIGGKILIEHLFF